MIDLTKIPENIYDKNFDSKKEEVKHDFDKTVELYREYVVSAETQEERIRRINKFRCG